MASEQLRELDLGGVTGDEGWGPGMYVIDKRPEDYLDGADDRCTPEWQALGQFYALDFTGPLPFEDGFFDTIYGYCYYCGGKEQRNNAKELYRILKHGGTLYVGCCHSERLGFWRQEYQLYLAAGFTVADGNFLMQDFGDYDLNPDLPDDYYKELSIDDPIVVAQPDDFGGYMLSAVLVKGKEQR